MSIVTISLGSKTFQLECNNTSEEELNFLVTKLNESIAKIKKTSPAAPFELLLVILALNLQEQVQNLTNELTKIKINKAPIEEEQFAETLNTIAKYLENLAKKVRK